MSDTRSSINSPKFWLVIPAAGVGRRMGADRPKQYLELDGKTILEHTLERLLILPVWSGVLVAISEQDEYWHDLAMASDSRITRVNGGNERADSVLNALNALAPQADASDWVLVHDAARPCVTVASIEQLLKIDHEAVGGILAVPAADTLKSVNQQRQISATLDRRSIWQAQTPQMFRFGLLRHALAKGLGEQASITDEASALELLGYQPLIVEGRSDNIKITRPEDLALARFILSQQQ